MSNSAMVSQEWRIADVNHDGTNDTVDLFPKYVFTDTGYVFNSGGNVNPRYADSDIRTVLNGTIFNGFAAEIRNVMKVQSFPSNGVTLSDKVKCPSVTEMGYNGLYSTAEGTIYPIFGTQYFAYGQQNSLAACKHADGGIWSGGYWTRSLYQDGTNTCVWRIDRSGYYSNMYCYNEYECIIACIRF